MTVVGNFESFGSRVSLHVFQSEPRVQASRVFLEGAFRAERKSCFDLYVVLRYVYVHYYCLFRFRFGRDRRVRVR